MFSVFLIALFVSSCKKEEVLTPILTQPVYEIARTSATFKATLFSETLDSVVEDGFCWGLNESPALNDDHNVTNHRDWNNDLILHTTYLLPDTKYYVRAYAKTGNNLYYGNTVNFTTKSPSVSTSFNPALTYSSVQDIDGNLYKTIQIGNQEWMAENLKTKKLNNGSDITVYENGVSWSLLNTEGVCWYENNKAIFGDMYGAYYNWYTVNTGILCPAGWHVPDEEDWKELKMALGMTEEQADLAFGFAGSTEGDKIKESGTFNWISESTPSTNESGFTALPGGLRSVGPADFLSEGLVANWWSSTEYFGINAWSHGVGYSDSRIYRSNMYSKSYGLNVRCVKNSK